MKRLTKKINLKIRWTALVVIELAASVCLATFLSNILHILLGEYYTIHSAVELFIISLLVGSFLSIFLGRWFFDPIKNLGDAMNQVAAGDFNITLEQEYGAPEIREINTNFNLMVKELNAIEVLQSDFVSNVSHEFKTPITAIEGYAMLLQDNEMLSLEEQAEYIDKILVNTKRLSNLVGNILLISKIDNQAIQSKMNRFRLDEQIRQSIVLLETEWSRKNIEFDVEMEDVEYFGNESLMHHIWDNLIGNAIKFNPVNGWIKIKLNKYQDKIIFTIEDNGPGIDESTKKHIFDKFYQCDSSHKAEGNGLGLALVKQILSVSNGEIEVFNIPDAGCRFVIVLHLE